MGEKALIDLRALALVRITLALTVLVDILGRWRDLTTFYTDQGVLSSASYLSQSWQYSGYHFFLASGSISGVSLLFLVWTAATICLLLGYKTRLAALLTWYFVTSIQLRNPLLSYVSDDFLRVMLFWTPLLPIAACWSLEARKNPKWQELPQNYFSPATVGILTQLSVLFFFMAYLKTGEEWIKTGDACYFILANDQVSSAVGHWLLSYPQLLKALTRLDLFWEYSLAILILLGAKFYRAKVIAFAMGLLYFFAIAILLNLGLSPLVGLASIAILAPNVILNKLDKLWARLPAPSIKEERARPCAYALEWPLKVFSAFMIAMIIIFNLYSIKHHHKVPPWSKPIIEWTFEQQHWHIFAPTPYQVEGWFIFEIQKEDGSLIDGFDPKTAVGQKPQSVSSHLIDYRWSQWLQNLYQIDLPDKEIWRKDTLNFLINSWQKKHPDLKVKRFRLIWMRKTNGPPNSNPLPVKPIILARQVPQKPESNRDYIQTRLQTIKSGSQTFP